MAFASLPRARGWAFLIFGAAFALSLLFAGTARAQAPDLYIASGVSADIEGDIATAREAAMFQAQREGLRQVVAGIAGEDAVARVTKLSDEQITAWVYDFEIEEEKASATRYIGRFTFRYAAPAVRDFLTTQQVKFASVQAKPVLVLPLYTDETGATLLWGDSNAWLKAWATRSARTGLVPLIVPTGDLEDIGTLTPQQAAAGDQASINAMLQRYHAAEALIATARLQPADGAGNFRLDLSATRRDGAGMTTVAHEEILSGGAADQLLTQGVARLEDTVQQGWKTQNLVDAARTQIMEIRVPIGDLRQWIAIKERLSGVAAIKGADLMELTKREAHLKITYAGDQAQFVHALAQRDLTLVPAASGVGSAAPGGIPSGVMTLAQ